MNHTCANGLTISDMMNNEMAMYDYHCRRHYRTDKQGWLRNCTYSIAQQVFRQDPSYYALYVSLRPDHGFRLISYPYYCGYKRETDSTQFRHINVNPISVRDDQHGKDMIQSSVSLHPLYCALYVSLLDHGFRLISYPYYRSYKRETDYTQLCHIDVNPVSVQDEEHGKDSSTLSLWPATASWPSVRTLNPGAWHQKCRRFLHCQLHGHDTRVEHDEDPSHALWSTISTDHNNALLQRVTRTQLGQTLVLTRTTEPNWPMLKVSTRLSRKSRKK